MAEELTIYLGSRRLAVIAGVMAALGFGTVIHSLSTDGWSFDILHSLFLSAVVIFFAAYNWWTKDSVRLSLSDSHINCPQPHADSPSTVAFAELKSLRSDSGSLVCFLKSDGGTYVINLFGLSRGRKQEVRRHLAGHLSFYEPAT